MSAAPFKDIPEKIVWSERYSIGNKTIDDQHKNLYKLLNEVIASISDNNDVNNRFAIFLSQMTDYALSHFKEEEEYMRSIGYPNLGIHKNIHKGYLKHAALLNNQFLSLDPPDMTEVANFLINWWWEHITTKDMKFANFAREKVISHLRDKLNSVATEQGKISGERFFKERVTILGAKSADVTNIAKEFYKELEDKDKSAIFALADQLFTGQVLEESFVACNWVYAKRKEFTEWDIDVFEKWIESYVTNWATCDTFCNHTMGYFIDLYPGYISRLKEWTKSPNRWMRRAAAVSLIIPAREGRYLKSILEIATLLLTDGDDMVQKGYGWMLKSCSQAHLTSVFNYVMSNKNKMPRTSLRYAIEKMPPEMKAEAMKRV